MHYVAIIYRYYSTAIEKLNKELKNPDLTDIERKNIDSYIKFYQCKREELKPELLSFISWLDSTLQEPIRKYYMETTFPTSWTSCFPTYCQTEDDTYYRKMTVNKGMEYQKQVPVLSSTEK